MPSDLIPSAAFGPLGRPRDEELRFWRLIDERTADDKGERVMLACGHEFVCGIPYPDSQEYAYCRQCCRKWFEAEKKS